jgi:hypothetical protein
MKPSAVTASTATRAYPRFARKSCPTYRQRAGFNEFLRKLRGLGILEDLRALKELLYELLGAALIRRGV